MDSSKPVKLKFKTKKNKENEYGRYTTKFTHGESNLSKKEMMNVMRLVENRLTRLAIELEELGLDGETIRFKVQVKKNKYKAKDIFSGHKK
jgi:hypothetical protein